jgi:hypothetical protein
MDAFSKSCFFGIRCLEILELSTFPLGYDEIYETSKQLQLTSEYRAVIDAALAYRKSGLAVHEDILYKNISLLDSVIEPKIIKAFNEQGNHQLL